MTPAYASIEQMNQQKAEPYFDLWALGVTIYRMIAGKVPEFKGNKFNPLPTNYS
jgi:serine/threonine protein kinase